MKHASVLLLIGVCAVVLTGCSTCNAPRFVHDTVRVPQRFQGARACVGDISDHERYVEAFEDGWWDCISFFVDDIDYHSTAFDRAENGWPSAVEGYADGFNDAERQVLSNVRRYGKVRTRQAIQAIWNAP
jgi:hypothetical protein